VRSLLSICIFVKQDALLQLVVAQLHPDFYTYSVTKSFKEFCQVIEQEKQQIDCLILQDDADLTATANWLHGQATLLPAVLLQLPGVDRALNIAETSPAFTYHTAEVPVTSERLLELPDQIQSAIAQFLNLSPACRLTPSAANDVTTDLTTQNFLMLQQRRLAEKLKARLGYLGVYYKRNSKSFFRHLSEEDKKDFLEQLKAEYREIVLLYFADDGTLNQRIDEFVNTAFFADISVSQIVETHMELMDEFSKQLKLEGRSEEILLDYRLTLIDTIAHLCEMYRRSIPRES